MGIKLAGRTALVTGASRGIGKAVTLALACEGANVIGVSRTEESAEKVRQEIETVGVEYFPLGVDVSDESAIKAAVAQIPERFRGSLSILVNNAGITMDKLVMRLQPEDWSATLATNLCAASYLIKALGFDLIHSGQGRIINMSSVVGLRGNAGQAAYSAAKAGMIALTQSVAQEFASRGVTCNAICPGFIQTDMTAGLSDTIKHKVLTRIPLGRFGKPEDVANLVVYLCTEGGYITGQSIVIDGGMSIS